MDTPTKDTSILGQRNDKATSSKWGNDIFSYDINAALKQYDNDLAEYNDPNTTSTRKTVINNKYGGDITAFDKTALYSDYQRDLQFVNYVDALENAKNTALNQAKKDETQKLQYADTRNALMQKYIPETLYAQGIANTGYTADALLKAENKYNQYALNAMNERSAKEENTMQEYQKAFSDFKLEQDEQAYKDFLSREEKRKAEEEKRKKEEEKRKTEEDAIQFEIKANMLEWYNYGYIKEDGTGMMNGEGAKATMKLMGATNETINEFIEFYNANEKGANLKPLPQNQNQNQNQNQEQNGSGTTQNQNQNGGGVFTLSEEVIDGIASSIGATYYPKEFKEYIKTVTLDRNVTATEYDKKIDEIVSKAAELGFITKFDGTINERMRDNLKKYLYRSYRANKTIQDAQGNAATFIGSNSGNNKGEVYGVYAPNDYIVDNYSGSLVATSSNGDDPLRVDPKFSSFNFNKAGDKGKVTFNGDTYKLTVSDPQPESFATVAKNILGDNYKDHAVFMYNNEIYMVSAEKYSNGSYKVYLMDPDGGLAYDIKKELKKYNWGVRTK